jgi:endonuclease G
MSKSRSLAFFTAVNIDGSQLIQIDRKNDRWYFDPRIDRSYQTGPELYINNDLDRGHLVRRLDPVWGDSAKEADEDTFHFTNCSPQHKNLNQITWLGLEDYILTNADRFDLKVSVFTGPVFREDDMLYRRKFQIPAEFWKVVVLVKMIIRFLQLAIY